MNRKSRKGFSLVEVLIVVVIIGILTALAIPAFNKVKKAAKIKAISSNLKTIAAAGSHYILENDTASAPYSSLVGNYFTPITPVAGEDYTQITVLEAGKNNTLTTTMNDGTIVTVDY